MSPGAHAAPRATRAGSARDPGGTRSGRRRSSGPGGAGGGPGDAGAVRRGRRVVFGFIPALDGLRALAVVGVMCYHGGASFLPGGYLTIDVFFVLSGFLITSLLVGEWGRIATIRLGQFWARRARRLLPALLVLLVGVALYARLLATPGEFANLRLDSLSALFYVANWHFILAGSNYFNLTAQPSPLDHMWSLSIEEQFYLVWPPVVLGMLALGRRLRPSRRLWPLLGVAVAGALASAVEMGLLYRGPNSVMRVYEGTDTRAQDLLVGAALAVAMAIWAQHRPAVPANAPGEAGGPIPSAAAGDLVPPGRRTDVRRARTRTRGIRLIEAWEITPRGARVVLQVAGWAAAAVFAYAWSHFGEPGRGLYRGGYLVVALGVAVVIFVSVTNQNGPLARALGNPVFRYIGKISYGAYLWHFPLFAALDAERLHIYGLPLLLVRILATLGIASVSFYAVEEPLRRKRFRFLSEWRAWAVTSTAFVAVMAATVVATVPTAADAVVVSNRPVGAQYTGPPVRAMMLGDSVGETLGFVLTQQEQPYDVNLENSAILGCGVIISSLYRTTGHDYGPPVSCDSSAPASQQWPAVWQGRINRFRPSVVLFQAGRWEITDQKIDGRWQHIGQPAFDALLRNELTRALKVATSKGALVMALTSPCFDSGEQPNGQPWPEDSPARVARYNAMLAQVVAHFPRRAEVFPLGAEMCPGGVYHTTLDGVEIRNPADGVHIPPLPATGVWYASRVFPEVVRLGRLQQAGENINGTPVTTTTAG